MEDKKITTSIPDHIIYNQERPMPSAGTQGCSPTFSKWDEMNLPDWHIAALDRSRILNPKYKAPKVYTLTASMVEANTSTTSQKARRVPLPVLPGMGYLAYAMKGNPLLQLMVIPDEIYPHPCGLLYGNAKTLCTFRSEWDTESDMVGYARQHRLKVAAVKMQEYNPDVSFSYAGGCKAYTLDRVGGLEQQDMPDLTQFIQGLSDNQSIIAELSTDLNDIMGRG